MKISIITSTYNCQNELQKTIDSIKKIKINSIVNIEWIIVDGASNDKTLKLIEENRSTVDHFITEPDQGIYDAWNKACQFITGDWVLFLGAGDTLIESKVGVFFNLLKAVNPTEYKLVYGNVRLLSENGNYIKQYSKVSINDWKNCRPALPSHQGTFQHASLFAKENVFDTKYQIAADSKFLLESMKISPLLYIDIDISNMQSMGVSTDPKHVLRVKRELLMLKNDIGYDLPLFPYLIFMLKSYIKHFLTHYLKIKLKPRTDSK